MSNAAFKHEKIVGWLLIFGFIATSGIGASKKNCCCTVLDCDQRRIADLRAMSNSTKLTELTAQGHFRNTQPAAYGRIGE